MKTVRFVVQVEIPDEDLTQAEQNAFRYFWNEIAVDAYWETKVTLDG